MFIVKNSPRAFLFALLPLLLIHGMLLGNALMGSQANPPTMALPPPDKAFGMLMLRVAIDAIGLMLGHFVCRGLGVGRHAAYAMIGGLAAAGGYALSLQQGLMPPPPYEGVRITAGILPTLTGMVAGFLYCQFARRESLLHAGAEPAEAGAIAARFPNVTAVVKPVAPVAFDGPIQFRTSIAAMFIASFVPALLITLLFFVLSYGLLSGVESAPDEPIRFNWSNQIMAFALPAQMFVMTAITTTIPCAIFVGVAHGIARTLRWTTGLAYAGVGALVGLGCGISLIPFAGWPSFSFTGGGFLILPFAMLGALMMAVYRRFAGLEPRPLPEPVLATEIEALVPEDHPARRSHAVVLNG